MEASVLPRPEPLGRHRLVGTGAAAAAAAAGPIAAAATTLLLGPGGALRSEGTIDELEALFRSF